MKKAMALGLAVLMAATFVGCGNASATKGSEENASTAATSSETAVASETAAPADNGKFVVGFDQDFPPMGFKGDDGEFTGFDLELAAEAAKRMGKEVVFQPIAWDSKDAELDAGTIDCIWNGFTISGREDDYTWSEAYMDNSQVFVVRNDSDIKTAADLAGKVVEVQADSSAEAALKEEENQELAASFGTLQTTPDYNTAMMDLDMGSVDAIAMDSTVAEYKITSGGMDLRVLDEPFASEQYGIGFKKGNTELCDEVSAAMKDMASDGTLAEISNKWFGRDVTTISK